MTGTEIVLLVISIVWLVAAAKFAYDFWSGN